MDPFGRLRPLVALLFAASSAVPAGAQICLPPGAVQASFNPASFDNVLGVQPHDVAMGEFNHDGLRDLAVLNVMPPGNTTVRVMLGAGGGTSFTATVAFNYVDARDVVVADFDRNGFDDIAVAGGVTNNVFVSFNFGGVFAGVTPFPVPGNPIALAAGDLNDNGIPDIAVARADGNVTTLRGNGLGGFALFATLPMVVAFDMVAADITRDGILDLVAADAGGDRVNVASGRGDGSFNAPVPSPTGRGPESLTVGDFNKDGFLDVVTVDGLDQTVTFLKGDGTVSLGGPVPYPIAGGEFHRVNKGDFDRDGALDLVVNDNLSNLFYVFENNGDGTFVGPEPFVADSENFDSAVADFDRDGRDDIAVTLSNANAVELHLSILGIPCTKPSFAWAGRFIGVGLDPVAITTAFIDPDGRPDFLVADMGSSDFARANGLGNGDFNTSLIQVTAGPALSIAAADVDGDLDVDVFVATTAPNEMALFLNDGLGNLVAGPTFPLFTTPVHVVLADVSGDGKNDVIVTLATTDVIVGINDGTGLNYAGANYAVGPSPGSVSVADINNDGLLDLAVTEAVSSSVVFFDNVGGGMFVAAGNVVLGSSPRSARLAHLDSDGNIDLVVARGVFGASVVESLTGNGAFGFGATDVVPTGGTAPGPHGLFVGDLNGDGDKDVAAANSDLVRVDIVFGNGGGSFSGSRFEMTGVGVTGLTADDVDRDGSLDLLVTQRPNNRVQALLNDGTGAFSRFHPAPGADTRAAASGDFDRDGKLDLVLANFSNDAVTFFLGTGGGGFAPGIDYSISPSKGPVSLSVDDFDNDGDLDVVASAETSFELVFLPWTGGGFGAPIASLTDGAVSPLINRAGDFDLDGNPDIAVNTVPDRRVQILAGDGAGNFGFQIGLSPGGVPTGLQVGDFNRDGLTDVAVTQNTDSIIAVYHLIQRVPLGFNLVNNPNVAFDPRDFDVVDIDHNGFVEFAIPTASGQVSIVGDAASAYVLLGNIPSGLTPVALRALDVDRDGFEDLVVADPANQVVVVMRSDTFGGFPDLSQMTPGVRAPSFLEVADFDMDGRRDVAVAPDTIVGMNPPGVAILLNTNCRSRLFRIQNEPSTCDLPPNPFSVQPRLDVIDDGANLVRCELRNVSASVSGGASLNGLTSVTPSFGSVQYTNLGVNLPGGLGLHLEFNHAEARPKLSDTFTQAPIVDITGPLNLCLADPAVYDATPGFEMYNWTLDASGQPQMASTIDLTGLLSAGPHTLDVLAERDACFAVDSEPGIFVNADLSSVSAAPPGPHTVCPTCTGPTLTATPTGGGVVTYQWGYRTVSAGFITPIPGETSPTYAIKGPDFPMPAGYFVVVTVTPTCGAPMISNEVDVTVSAAAGPTPVTAFTALSTSTRNRLEWTTPATCTSVRIIRRVGSFPTDPNDLVAPNVHVNGTDFPCPAAGGKDFFDDAGLSNGTKYFYSAFVEDSSNYSLRRSVSGLPFNNAIGNVLWSLSTGAAAMAQAGVRVIGPGTSAIYVVTNDSQVIAVNGGPGGGQWLTNAVPFLMGGPSQVWPPVVNFPVGISPDGAAFVSSQDGMLYAVNADDTTQIWASAVGEALLQAGAAGYFSPDRRIVLGTRNTIADNELRVFDADTGALELTFDNNSTTQGGDDSLIGIVLGAASIDVTAERVFFGSYIAGNYSIWSVDISGSNPQFLTGANVGDVEASPIYMAGSPSRIAIGTKAGDVDLLDASDLTLSLWSSGFNPGDGGVKGFVIPHRHGANQNFMFSTASKLTSIRDNGIGTAPTQNWQIDFGTSPAIPNPSIPLFLFGTNTAIVGGSDGRIYQLNDVDTATPTTFTPVVLGDGSAAVGPPSFDIANFTIYVGTDAGVIYAVQYPLLP